MEKEQILKNILYNTVGKDLDDNVDNLDNEIDCIYDEYEDTLKETWKIAQEDFFRKLELLYNKGDYAHMDQFIEMVKLELEEELE